MPPQPAIRSGRGPAVSSSNPFVASSRRWGVPTWILIGIYGAETTFGHNVAVSSAGAIGPMQFLPSTWAQYGHGDPNNLSNAVDAAGHLLHDLHAQYGSWAAAVEHYSGGGYDLAHVKSESQQAPGNLTQLASLHLPGWLTGPAIPGVGDGGLLGGGNPLAIPGQILDAAEGFVSFFKLVTSIAFWIRVAEGIAGLILIHLALKNMSGNYADAAAGARRRVRETAEAATLAAA